MKCLRCKRDFENPVPSVTNADGNMEIACRDWCPDCNTLAMSIIFRESSAYRTKELYDPLRWPKQGGARKHAD